MELTRVEQATISVLVSLSILATGLFSYLRTDTTSVWYAVQTLVTAVLLVLAYATWYRGAPPNATVSPGDPYRSKAAIDLTQRRSANRAMRLTLYAICVVLLLGFILLTALGHRHSLLTFAISLLLTVLSAWSCWLHFPAQTEIPSEDFKQPEAVNSNGQEYQTHVELLKLEYSKGAERYENIYKAVWQNFYYMSVVSAGLLTFGQRNLAAPILAFFAVTPVAFWYFATFLPMDLYGQEVRRTLRRVENYINATVGKNLLAHFADFANFRFFWRVRDTVRGFGTVLTFAWIAALIFASSHVIREQFATAGTADLREAVHAELVRLEALPHPDSSYQSQLARLDTLLTRLQLQRALDSSTKGAPSPKRASSPIPQHATDTSHASKVAPQPKDS